MKKRIIGYTSGVFDLFHIGHLNILRNAKSMCDKLIVGVSTDDLLFEYKKKKPVITFQERLEIVRNIKYVDVAIPQFNRDKKDAWKKLKFDTMFVGSDWFDTDKWKDLDKYFNKKKVKVVYFPYTLGTSSTKINQILDKNRKK